MILTVLTEAKLTAITPQFLVLDLRAACTFYAEKLGFHVAFTYSDFYAGVERDGVTIHLKLSDSPDPSRQAKQRDSHLGATGNTINKELCAAKYCTIESLQIAQCWQVYFSAPGTIVNVMFRNYRKRTKPGDDRVGLCFRRWSSAGEIYHHNS